MSSVVQQIAEKIRSAQIDKPFGIVKFFGMSIVPMNDQSYQLVSAHADGDRLDLGFVHESRAGLPGVISVWAPEGVEIAAAGLTIRSAARLRLDDSEAQRQGDNYQITTPRGTGVWPIEGEPALVLTR